MYVIFFSLHKSQPVTCTLWRFDIAVMTDLGTVFMLVCDSSLVTAAQYSSSAHVSSPTEAGGSQCCLSVCFQIPHCPCLLSTPQPRNWAAKQSSLSAPKGGAGDCKHWAFRPPSSRRPHPPGGSVCTPKHKAAPPPTVASEECLYKKSFCANTLKTEMAFCSYCFCRRRCSLVITSPALALLRVCRVPLGSTWLWALEWFLCCLVPKSRPTLLRPHGLQPTRLLCLWDFPGKNTGVLEGVAISSSRESSRPRDRTCISYIGRQILSH